MAERSFETEITRSIWNNSAGTKITVKPDGDGLGLIELFGESNNLIVVYPAEARLLAEALRACADDVDPVDMA